MNRRVMIGAGIATLAAVGGMAALASGALWPRALPETPPLTAPGGPLATYHLGHSLVGRDMPAMLAQLAGSAYASQLGWGSSLRDHARGTVAGYDTENAHPYHVPATAALASGDYDVVVLTEMVELADAIRHHNAPRWLAHWARLAKAANAGARVYLYESWHRLDDPAGWLTRIDDDLTGLWTDRVLTPAMRTSGVPIYLIPAGQVIAAVVRAAEAGAVPGLTNRRALFTDAIHLDDLGAYVVALAHYATIYQRDPTGLPHDLNRADGTPATRVDAGTARAVQQLVWSTVNRYAATGIAKVS